MAVQERKSDMLEDSRDGLLLAERSRSFTRLPHTNHNRLTLIFPSLRRALSNL